MCVAKQTGTNHTSGQREKEVFKGSMETDAQFLNSQEKLREEKHKHTHTLLSHKDTYLLQSPFSTYKDKSSLQQGERNSCLSLCVCVCASFLPYILYSTFLTLKRQSAHAFFFFFSYKSTAARFSKKYDAIL